MSLSLTWNTSLMHHQVSPVFVKEDEKVWPVPHRTVGVTKYERRGYLNLPGHGTFRALSEVSPEVATREVTLQMQETDVGTVAVAMTHSGVTLHGNVSPSLRVIFILSLPWASDAYRIFSMWSPWLGLSGDNSVVCISVKHTQCFKFCRT